MKGATNTIAKASASGIIRIAVMKQKVANSKSKDRNVSTINSPRATRNESLIIQTNGAISAHCTTKRAAVIYPTGTLADASFAATSSKGAVRQNPSISATPARMRSLG
ncbi:MAG: hypothetical protein AAF625_15650, partial [Pseudomonadota bacterium]